MGLKNFAKKAVVAAIIGSFAIGGLAACSSDSDKGSSSSAAKTSSQNVRGKDSNYSTK